MTAIQTYMDTFERDGYAIAPNVFDPDRALAVCWTRKTISMARILTNIWQSRKRKENIPLLSRLTGFNFLAEPEYSIA